MEKVFEVTLSNAYKILIQSGGVKESKRLSEFYTGDILDISKEKDRKKHNFQIKNFECVENNAFEHKENERS